ncbi:MAG: nucleotidyltransferase domain-containing protein [Candidatus Babeliaceae bacterium]|nr:nucleotidyltransferase domain-containing protein [Candidatus Babeliaceae bacterium]
MNTDTQDIAAQFYPQIYTIVRRHFPQARIYLFGSRATHKNRPGSDIDIAIDNGSTVDFATLLKVWGELDESNIPYKVDLVDLQASSESFRQEIFKKGVLWNF